MLYIIINLNERQVFSMKNTKQCLLSISNNSFFHLPLFAHSIGVSKSSFVSGLISGEYQVIKIEKGYALLHFGRFVPEWNPFVDLSELPESFN